MAKYDRGGVWIVDLGMEGKVGSEQKGRKPVCIVQNDIGNANAPTVIVAVITSQQGKAKLPTHVDVPKEVGMHKPSVILCEQIFTIDKSRLVNRIGKLTEFEELNKAVGISLGIIPVNSLK